MAILEYGNALRSAPNPTANAMQSAGQMQGLMQNKMAMEQQQKAIQDQELQQQQRQMALQQGADLLMGDDYDAQADFMFKNPDVAKEFIGAMNFKDGSQIADRIEFNKSVVSSSADPSMLLQKRIEEVRAKGGDTENLEDTLALGNPEKIRNELRKELNFLDAKSMMAYNKLESGGQEPMTEYQSAMVDKYKIDQELRRLEIAKAKAKNDLQKDKLQVEIDDKKIKLQEAEKNIENKGIDLDFEVQAIQDEGQGVLDLLDKIESHEGLDSAVGFKGSSSVFGLFDEPIAGSPAASAVALIDNLEAKNFITAVGQFKAKGGAGSLSDSEGKKLAASLTNLNRNQSLESFKESLNEVRRLVQLGMDRTAQKQSAKKGDQQPMQNAKTSNGMSEQGADDFLNSLGF